jgi:hypothetical protein
MRIEHRSILGRQGDKETSRQGNKEFLAEPSGKAERKEFKTNVFQVDKKDEKTIRYFRAGDARNECASERLQV